MQNVPQEWIDKHTQPILPLSDLLITFDIADVEAKNKISSINLVDGSVESNTNSIINQTMNYSSFYILDNGGLILDGNAVALDSSINRGYIGVTPTNNDGSISISPKNSVTINFSSVITNTLPYLSIQWGSIYNQYATKFDVSFYNGNTLINTISITNNTDVFSVVQTNVNNYNKIVITIQEWNIGNSVPKIEQIILGQRLKLTKENILKYNCNMEIELNSFSLPTHEISFDIDNSNDQFNPDNPSGIYSYLQERQEIDVLYGLKLDNGMYYINGGKFYITEWKVPQNSINATFNGGSLLDFMDKDFDITQVGSIPVTTTLANIITSAFTQCGIASTNYVIDNSLSNISCTIDTEVGYKCREMVQLCANAGECIIRIDRDGIINIEKFDINTLTDSGYKIDRFVSYKNADYNNTSSLKDVVVNDNLGYYSTGNAKGETQTMQNPLIQTQNRANSVAQWVASVLLYNKRLDGEWRADTRLDIVDLIKVDNKYATSIPLVITMINYTFNGIYKGKYEGRIVQ